MLQDSKKKKKTRQTEKILCIFFYYHYFKTYLHNSFTKRYIKTIAKLEQHPRLPGSQVHSCSRQDRVRSWALTSPLTDMQSQEWLNLVLMLNLTSALGLKSGNGLGSNSPPERQCQVCDGQDNSRFGQSRKLHQLRHLLSHTGTDTQTTKNKDNLMSVTQCKTPDTPGKNK